MADWIVVREALSLGYDITYDNNGDVWYSKGGQLAGPFKKLDDAAYAALSEHEEEIYAEAS